MELTLEIVKSIFWLIIVFIVLFDGSIAEWIEAKADKIRAEAEKIRLKTSEIVIEDVKINDKTL